MSVSDADIAFALELFDPLGALTVRKMFGGMCLYHQGTVFALMSAEGRLYIKASCEIANDLKNKGAEQFHKMPYWSLSEETLEDQSAAVDLARRALSKL